MRTLARLAPAAAAAAAAAPPCNLSAPADDYCEAYCEGKCGLYNVSRGDTGSATNITIYRLTPRAVLGAEDHNTGDAPGDVGFVLHNQRKTAECLRNETQSGCFLSNASNTVYGEFAIEIDGQYGPYYRCNPPYGNASYPFECHQYCESPPNCPKGGPPDNPWRNSSDGWQGTTCFCDRCERCTKAVGRSPNPYTYHPRDDAPDGWPKQCARFDAQPGCLEGSVAQTVSSWGLAATIQTACDACSDMGYANHSYACAGWSVVNDTHAQVFSTVTGTRTGRCVSGQHGRHWGGSVGVELNGWWYSTPMEGKCADGQRLGDGGCTWRYVSAPVYKEGTCVDARVDTAIIKHGANCFNTCEQPLNISSSCYNNCYASTLSGDAVHNVTAMTPEQVVAPWVSGFDSEDAGGCPTFTPTAP